MKLMKILQGILSLKKVETSYSKGIVAFSFKNISDNYLPHIRHLSKVKTFSEFETEIEYILKYFKPVSVDDLERHVSGKEILTDNCCLLIFEDCIKDTYEAVLPVLIKYKLPAIFFIDPRFINNNEIFYRHKASILVDVLSKNVELVYKLTQRFSVDFWELRNEIFDIIMSVSTHNRSLLDDIARDINFDFDKYLFEYSPYLTNSQIKEMLSYSFNYGISFFNSEEITSISESEIIQNVINSNLHLSSIPSIINLPRLATSNFENLFFNVFKNVDKSVPKIVSGGYKLKDCKNYLGIKKLNMNRSFADITKYSTKKKFIDSFKRGNSELFYITI
jgi:hypothetical protein